MTQLEKYNYVHGVASNELRNRMEACIAQYALYVKGGGGADPDPANEAKRQAWATYALQNATLIAQTYIWAVVGDVGFPAVGDPDEAQLQSLTETAIQIFILE